MARVYKIRIEYGRAPEGGVCITETERPVFSWAIACSKGEKPVACQLRVLHGGERVWDSDWRETSEQALRYAGPALVAGEVYRLEVRVRTDGGAVSELASRTFCPGTLSWEAAWITDPDPERRQGAVLDFVKDFTCRKHVASACLFSCGLGYQKIYLNGKALLDEPMNPAVSEFERRAYYNVLPGLECYLNEGENRLGIRVASGWRNPQSVCYKLVNRVAAFTGPTQLSAMLRLRYDDGTVAWLRTDETWSIYEGPTRSADIFLGERYEAAYRIPDWAKAGTELPGLRAACLTETPSRRLCPQTLEWIRRQERYPARTVSELEPGLWAIDFGQNIAGVVRIRIPRNIQAGQVLQLRHMEYLNEDGRLLLQQLRNAESRDTYVAAGGGRDPEFWEPEFTYHGFRYAELSGYPEALLCSDVEAVSFYTDVVSGSQFSCGSALVSAIAEAAFRTEKANIHSILTDCPQRDERMAWLNDATARFEMTPYRFDVGRLFPKVVRDCMDVQDEDGSITCTAPFAFGMRPADPVCSAYLIAAWEAWLHTGNLDILREAYPGLAAWNRFLESKTEDGIVNYSYYGDWAAPAYACKSEEFAVSAVTPGVYMSTGYYYYNACLLARIADLLGYRDEAEAQRQKAQAIQQNFLAKWWDETTGKIGSGSQACQAFALWLDILPPEGRQKAADYLRRDLVAKDYHFTTGNLCTRYMLEMLMRYGYVEDAWAVLTREDYPSLGYMLQNEATTIWERFELKKNPLMNSHNHPMHASVSYAFFAYLAGLQPTDAGWRAFRFKPILPQRLLSASASVETPYGAVTSRWVQRYGERHIYLTVPCGSTAQVELPWGERAELGMGVYHWARSL